ncbi:MAG: aldo/keto reductase [Candidatus Riflebacteria bacterium]|nr:aldo/keto reductase [Candidatus Riflebacteria bacterium]
MKRISAFLLITLLFFSAFLDANILFAAELSANGMEYIEVRNEKNERVKFSRLILGTDHLAQEDWYGPNSRKITEQGINELLDEAVRLGINLFDTSPIYVGDIEFRLGKWIESYRQKNPGKKLYTLSKGGFPFDLYWAKKLPAGENAFCLLEMLKTKGIMAEGYTDLPNVPNGTYASRLFGSKELIIERVSEELGHTMKNLKTYPDVYLMHRDDGDFINFEPVKRSQNSVKTIMEALSSREIREKYTFLGWSNWKPHRITRSLALAKKQTDLAKPVFNSPYFSLFEMSERAIHAGGVQVSHEDMQDENFLKGIKMMPYSPLGGISILDRPEPCWENARKDARRKYAQGDPYWKNVYHAIFTCANEERYNRVVRFTNDFNKKHKTSYAVDQMANAYALAHKRTDFLVIGPITIEQLRRTVAALKLSKMLTREDLDFLYYGNE